MPSNRWPLILFSQQDKFLQLTHSSHYSYSLEINSVEAIKLVGVTDDRELNLNDHVAVIVRKVSNQLQLRSKQKFCFDLSHRHSTTVSLETRNSSTSIRLHDVDF